MFLQAKDVIERAAEKAAARVRIDHGIGWVLLALATLFVVANWQVLFAQLRAKPDDARPSFVPFVGGALGVIALGMLDVTWRWRWIPVAVDFGSGGYLLAMVIALAASALAPREASSKERTPPPPSDGA